MSELKPCLNPALQSFWGVPDCRYRILYGGRSSSKTWDTTGVLINMAAGHNIRVLCVRRFQSRIEDSVYAALKTQIERFKVDAFFDQQASRLYGTVSGAEFAFFGIDRHITEIKGFEGADILYIEEAECLTEEQWGILQPTIRKEGSQIWIVFNPHLATDFVYRNFVLNPPKNAIIRKINYTENPFLSKTAKADIAEMEQRDPEAFHHVYLGHPLTDDEGTIIKRRWLESCVNAREKLGFQSIGKRIMGFDIADDGKDANALAVMVGNELQDLQEWKGGEDELLVSFRRAWNEALMDNSELVFDPIGVGASAGAEFTRLNQQRIGIVKWRKFNAAAAVKAPDMEYMPNVKNKDHFSNLKAQMWQHLADRARDTHAMLEGKLKPDPDKVFSIAPGLPKKEQLLNELSTPRRDYSGARQLFAVESKEKLAKRGIASHNLADAVVMAAAPNLPALPKAVVGKWGMA